MDLQGGKNMRYGDIVKLKKAVVENFDDKILDISVYIVQRCCFNDERLIASKRITKEDIDGKELQWFDVYLGKHHKNNYQIAFVYISGEDVYFLEKINDEIGLMKKSVFTHIISDDFDKQTLIATHINVFSK